MLYESPPARGQDRRLLLLSYHFAPSQRIGAIRWQKFACALAERGWALDVVTLEPEAKPDDGFAGLPAGIRVFGVPDPTPLLVRMERRAGSMMRALRNGSDAAPTHTEPATALSYRRETVPRAELRWRLHSPSGAHKTYVAARLLFYQLRWALRAERVARRLLARNSYEGVIASGPPHMVYEAGRRAAGRAGVPFVMDMRDSWSVCRIVHHGVATPLWFTVARSFEAVAVRAADLVVVNTELFREAMIDRYPGAAPRFVTIRNGWDDEPVPRAPRRERFTIMFSGTLYHGRDPRPLFRAVARVVQDLGIGPDRLGITLMGDVEQFAGVPTLHAAREAGVDGYVTVTPWRSRQDAAAEQASASMLVSLPWPEDLSVPGKIYDYMRYDAWILVFAPPHSAPARLLGDSGVELVAPDDVNGAARIIRSRFEAFMAGARPRRLADERFSRRREANRLLAALDGLSRRADRPLSRRGAA
ncbi:MAG: glycosyltransferase [Longimicrobiales bacterium]